MNFIDSLALSTAKFICENNKNAASEKVLFYALSLIINTFIACIIVVLICSVTGHLKEAILVTFFYTLLRYVSGGTHLSSSLGCCIFSIVLFTVLAHVSFPFSYLEIGQVLTIVTAIILIITAPNGIENVSRIKPKYYPLLKIISVLIVLFNIYLQSSIVCCAFLFQAFQTTPYAKKMFILIERRITHEN